MSAPEGPVFARRRFRPTRWSTVFALLGVAALIALGTWQLDRLAWKQDLIQRLEARGEAPPISLDQALADPAASEYRRLRLTGRYLHDRTLYISSKTYDGRVGFHVVTPLETAGGRTVLVDRGWTPPDAKDPQARLDSLVEGETTVAGLVRIAGWRGSDWFKPENQPAESAWLYIAPQAMAEALGVSDVLPEIYLSAAAGQHPGRYPLGGRSEVRVRDQHLEYAITWYALALGLAGVWLAFSFRRVREEDDA